MYQDLYFIAIVPPSVLKERVKALKEEMKDRFGVKHALRSLAHITLQMPFKRVPADESLIIDALREFASEESPFAVNLSGFDCFSPRVIFVKVEDHSPIVKLHENLQGVLTGKLDFSPKDLSQRFHPHMTIATRDLTKTLFREAWPQYEFREFTASFAARSICLLKHNGRFWEEYMSFNFTQK